MSAEDSVMMWINGLKNKDETAAQQLWERYFQRLVALAGKKLPGHVKRTFDEEDVALSAFHSLCQGVQKDRFPELEDRDNLWSLLVVITARKAIHRLRGNQAEKRGGGAVRGESIFGAISPEENFGIDNLIGDSPTPEFALQICEESDLLMDQLPDGSFQEIARLKLAGYSNDEIVKQTGLSRRTVGRRLSLIRQLWNENG